MDFFQKQDDYKLRSLVFVMFFTIAVAFAVAALYFVITGSFLIVGYFSPIKPAVEGGGYMERVFAAALPAIVYGNPPEVFSLNSFGKGCCLLLSFIISLSLFKTWRIRKGGGKYVAASLGGRKVGPMAQLPERGLLNVVEEMAVAAALPAPAVYILEKELAINAVTCGLNHEDAVIVFTRGALNHLSRDELQAMAAHEFGHILNDDYKLNMMMAGWLYGLLFFYIFGRDMVQIAWTWYDDFSSAMNSSVVDPGSMIVFLISPKGFIGANMALMGLVLCIGGWLGKLGAELTQAALSRQREYLADAFAVQFVRQPLALAEVLKKIAGSIWGEVRRPDTLKTPQNEQGGFWGLLCALASKVVAVCRKVPAYVVGFFRFLDGGGIRNAQSLLLKAFFFTSPSLFRSLWDSHPPLEKRILALEPNWDGELPEIILNYAQGGRKKRPPKYSREYNSEIFIGGGLEELSGGESAAQSEI